MASECFAQLVGQYEQEAYRYSVLESYSVLQQLWILCLKALSIQILELEY